VREEHRVPGDFAEGLVEAVAAIHIADPSGCGRWCSAASVSGRGLHDEGRGTKSAAEWQRQGREP
jgi:hypothetical protein